MKNLSRKRKVAVALAVAVVIGVGGYFVYNLIVKLDAARAKVAFFEGTVNLDRNRKLDVGTGIREGDRVTTGADGKADIGIGGAGAVRLDADSVLRFEKVPEEGGEVILELEKGRVFNRVKKQEGNSGFRLKAPSGQIVVRGTQFFVEADGEETRVVVRFGKVEAADDSGKKVELGMGELVAVDQDGLGEIGEAGARELKLFSEFDEIHALPEDLAGTQDLNGKLEAAISALVLANPLQQEEWGLKAIFEIEGNSLSLDLSGNKLLWNLTPLEGLPITDLDLSGCYQLDDLAPLQGMPLRTLDISDTDAHDLAPLAGAPLEELDISRSKASDLEPIFGAPLRKLVAKERSITGKFIGPLPIEHLEIPNPYPGGGDFPTKDIYAALNAAPLRYLDISRMNHSDFKPDQIHSDTLETIILAPSKVGKDAAPLRDSPALKTIGIWRPWTGAPGEDVEMVDAAEFWKRHDANEFREQLADIRGRIETAIEEIKTLNPGASGSCRVEWFRIQLHVHGAADLSPLAGLPVTETQIRGPSSNLDALLNMPLRHVSCSNNSLSDLTGLRESPLQSATFINCLSLESLSGVSSPHLRRLNMFNTRVTDLTPIATDKLTGFSSGNKDCDITPLADAPLRSFTIRGSRLLIEGGLRGFPLRSLNIFGDKGSPSIDSIREMRLNKLILDNHLYVSDISALRGMPLIELHLNHTLVSDISPLAGAELETLSLKNTLVTDLTALRGMPLKKLNIAGTYVSDLTPLSEAPLESLAFMPWNIDKGLEAIRSITSLQKVGVSFADPESDSEEFWTRYDAGEHSLESYLSRYRENLIALAEENPDFPTPTFQYNVDDSGLSLEIGGVRGRIPPILGLPVTDLRLTDFAATISIGDPWGSGGGISVPTLHTLSIEDSPSFKNLTMRSGESLRSLTLINTGVTDLTPLAKLTKLEILRFNPSQITEGMEILRDLPALIILATESGKAMPKDEFFRKLEAGEL